MAKILILFCLLSLFVNSQAQDGRTVYFPKKTEYPQRLPKKKNVWIFIMAGQSNMAGRGVVEPPDTLSNSRILTINHNNEMILAKEPLHFYEPNLTGLDCGLSFATQLLKDVDSSITLLLLPTAVGGSSTHQWLGDSLHRNVKLLSNFRERVMFAKKHGTIKGILWHQGEADTESRLIPGYEERLQKLFIQLRIYTKDMRLPILVGELGSFSENQTNWDQINKAINSCAAKDQHVFVISTQDLKSKEDKIHFNSESQRIMGERFAKKYMEVVKK
jgi:hypothetical protein